MNVQLSPSAQKVQDALRSRGFPHQVIEIEQSTRTAVEAAEAVGCEVGQIVKSLVFRGQRTDQPVLVVASGANRADEARIAELLGEPIAKASPDYVRQHTGFAIGGVPPLGHPEPLRTFVDADLFQYAEIWAAAGTPKALFRLMPDELVAMTDGQVVRVRQG